MKEKVLKLKPSKRVLDIWEREKKFIEKVFILLPNSRNEVDEHLEDYLIDLSDSEETKKREKFIRKTKEIIEAKKAIKDETETIGEPKAKSKGKDAIPNGHPPSSAAVPPQLAAKKGFVAQNKPSREELLDRLHAKIAIVAQKKNSKKALAKKEKKLKKKDRTKDSKKQFTSKTNPNLKVKFAPLTPTTLKTEVISAEVVEKTPLRKTVKKSDGQVVYSKFDFITGDKQVKPKKLKPTELLKSAEKTEGKISRLQASGKTSEAVHIAESQKWITAVKRAQGEKVRDDPNLLKKTIKKQKKLKETSKKKWVERVENVEKQKELRVKKRLTNLQSRKDDKKKKQKKVQRKRGRIL